MYKHFFNLRERPFKLVPNPAFLYLGKTHEEALGNLTYAVNHGEGFLLLTGEVGTGKTTLCRMFLENLGHQTEAAYIFNPRLDSIQLLKAINDEFGISSTPDNIKDLSDILNRFLMEKKARRVKAVILIDEAQNLSRDVLEQLRLLSNLETTDSKLLLIILSGQPELEETLDSYELRQLSQRITLSCRLSPLTPKESRSYINHRIAVASNGQPVKFTAWAYNRIHRYSNGYPRLINIVCDRALLVAYAADKNKIGPRIVHQAIRELSWSRVSVSYGQKKRYQPFIILILAIIVLAAMIFHPPYLVTMMDNIEKPVRETAFEPAHSIKNPSPMESTKMDVPMVKLGNFLGELAAKNSRRLAFKACASLWGKTNELDDFMDSLDDDPEYFKLASKRCGLKTNQVEGDTDLLKHLNVPAILEMYFNNSIIPIYVAVESIDNSKIRIMAGRTVDIHPVDLNYFWTGRAVVVWKNFYNYPESISMKTQKSTILALKLHLQEAGYDNVPLNPFYGPSMKKLVMRIQKKTGLKADGIIGPLTIIALYNKTPQLKIPRLMPDRNLTKENKRITHGEAS